MPNLRRIVPVGAALLSGLVPVSAQPPMAPDATVMALDEVGVYAVGCAYAGQAEQHVPLGWSGFFEHATGVACEPFGTQHGRRAFLLHSPWRGGTGIAFQQFAFSLPESATAIRLRGHTAMRTASVADSDGVTFRVYTNHVKALEWHQADDVWRSFDLDLTSLRGSTLAVRFEVHPGPRNNASFDYSLWGDRELVLEGFSPGAPARPPPVPLALSNVWSVPNGEVAPRGAFPGATQMSLSNDVVRFRYAGPDGTLDYQWRRPQSAGDGLWGVLTLEARMRGDGPVRVPLATSARLAWTGAATAGGSRWVATNGACTLVRAFALGATNATVRLTGRLVGKSLVFDAGCDRPLVTALDIGTWGPVLRRRQVTTPFYSGTVYFLPGQNLFVNAALDWTASAASAHSGGQATYGALTDGTRNRLRERAVFTAAWHLAEVLPNIPHPPSPHLEFLADKMVLDNWGGRFTAIAAHLTLLADYGTAACYLDVHSAVPPWFHVDCRAGEPGAGQFRRVATVHRDLWAFERATHGGPVFGEGNQHWYWSGLLDGVEAQFGAGWPGNGGFDAPLSVDFDLLKIHPLQVNHGMGYYERWWPKDAHTNWGGAPPMIVLDQYRLQEVAYGHAAFLGASTYATLPLAWLDHHLVTPVMARYGAARPLEILYENHGAWLDASATARLPLGGSNRRVRVRYTSGLTVTANGASNALPAGSWTLPQFGWIAEGPGFAAGTVVRDGLVCDVADSGNTLFVNARPARDWNLSSVRRVAPRVLSVDPTGPRQFRVSYQWQIQNPPGQDCRCFVHFCSQGAIRWQQDHHLNPSPVQWHAGQTLDDGPWTVTVPPGVPDGDYDWLIGLFDPATGARLSLIGVDDGSQRIRLGALRLARNGAAVLFTPETRTPADRSAWYHAHLNLDNAVVDFGAVRTDGSARLARRGNAWSLQTWPRARAFTLELDARRFGQPARVQSVGGVQGEVIPLPAGSRWRLPLNGAREYRWLHDG
ncbi:MAG: hypothetical protein JXQ71_15420 [Verrucomicrobia bacterium]|nr:hypothetical protein [Verrucomicrobiota bacterium]